MGLISNHIGQNLEVATNYAKGKFTAGRDITGLVKDLLRNEVSSVPFKTK